MKYIIEVDGMHCMGCISTVKLAISELPSVKILNIKPGKVEIESNDDVKNEVTKKIEFYGYKVKSITAA